MVVLEWAHESESSDLEGISALFLRTIYVGFRNSVGQPTHVSTVTLTRRNAVNRF